MQITEENMLQAISAWGDGLVEISKAYEADGIDEARQVTEKIIDTLYGYAHGPVLFKPTMASGEQTFRANRKGAVSYFVGHDEDFPLDSGFGIKGWRKIVADTAVTINEGNVGLWMGNVHFTDKDNQVTTVDKSFGYKRDEQNQLKIILHHSSLPFQP